MKYNILIAEDDINIIELLTLYFDTNEFNVFYATDGSSALKIVKDEDIERLASKEEIEKDHQISMQQLKEQGLWIE